jgi:SSS family solute:Na+ symporter
MLQPLKEARTEADKGYVHLLQTVAPIGLRGLFLAALFGAIQSAINSVLNSTATVFTLDIYKRTLFRRASERHLVVIGMISSVVILAGSVILAGFINRIGGNLFVYIQSLYAFFAPPFGAVFLLGILWRRINGAGATMAVLVGFAMGIGLKIYVNNEAMNAPLWLKPFAIQSILVWLTCVFVCITVSFMTPRPLPSQVTDEMTLNWRRLNIFGYLGTRWYNSVVLWWGLFVAIIAALILVFSVVL